jgi:hypothetical protein
MIYRGHVKNGVIVLDENVSLPEGTEVKIEALVEVLAPHDESEIPTLYERLGPVIGMAKGLPPDFAKNHDHYILST